MIAATAALLLAADDTFDPATAGSDPDVQALLSLLAWCATAAGVLGLIILGILMTLRVYSGQPGEGGMYFKQFVYVIVACVMAATAGPVTQFVIGF